MHILAFGTTRSSFTRVIPAWRAIWRIFKHRLLHCHYLSDIIFTRVNGSFNMAKTKHAHTDNRQPTMADVARAAGVSRSAASLAFSGRRPISPAVKRRVFDAAKRMHYVPNRAAQALRAGRTRTLALLIRDMHDQWAPVLIEEIKSAAAELGYYLSTIFQTPSLESREETYLRGQADGVIIHAAPLPEELRQIIDQGFPAAELMRSNTHPDIVCGTEFSQDEACIRLLDHLHHLGHREFGLLWMGQDHTFSLVINHLRKLRIAPASDRIIEGVRLRADGERAFRELRRRCPEVTALVCYNDTIAVGAMVAAHQLGLKIPADLSVTGNGDIELGQIWSPRLTTLQYPVRQICRQTVRRLVDRIEGKPLIPAPSMTAELVIRESIGPVPSRRR